MGEKNIWLVIQDFNKKVSLIVSLVALLGLILLAFNLVDFSWSWLLLTPCIINIVIDNSSNIIEFVIAVLLGAIMGLLMSFFTTPRILVWVGILFGSNIYFYIKSSISKKGS